MTNKYCTIIDTLKRSMKHFYDMDVEIEEIYGANLFPECSSDQISRGGSPSIGFNEQLDVVLALYNLSLIGSDIEVGPVIAEFVRFHSFLDQDKYEQATDSLARFKCLLAAMPIGTEQKGTEEIVGLIGLQIYFLLMHEATHLLFARKPSTKEVEMQQTRALLHDGEAEMKDLRERFDINDIVNDPKIQERIDAMIPKGLPSPVRWGLKKVITKKLKNSPYNPDYVCNIAEGENLTILEELTCDRVAWLSLMNVLDQNQATAEDVIQIHIHLYVTLILMEFYKVLMSHFIPSVHGTYVYDGRLVMLRQSAMKNLLRQYKPDIESTHRVHYADLNSDVESYIQNVFASGLYDEQQLSKLYSSNKDAMIDYDEIDRLNDEMNMVVSQYLKL